MNFRDRRKYWMQSARQMRTIELMYVRKVEAILKRQVKDLIAKAEIYGFPEAIRRMDMFNAEMIELIGKIHKRAGMQFGQQVNRLIQQEVRKDIFFNAELLARLNEILGVNALQLVTYMDETTKAELLKILQEGVAQQLTFTQISEKMLQSGIVSFWRALMITRTEVVRAANTGAIQAARMSQFEQEKFWIAGKDKLTRTFAKKDEYDHWALDGRTVDIQEKFVQLGRTNGITVYADHPGDVNCSDNRQASAAFNINCRCTVGFRAKRDARGRLIKKIIPG